MFSLSIPLLLSTFVIEPVLAQRPEFLAKNSAEIEVLPVQGSISMIATGGSNIAVMVGELGSNRG